jgi:hypothetical protein
MKKMDWCDGCVFDIEKLLCIVQEADLSDLCPCGECIVKVSCTYSSQECISFSNLYDICDNILKRRNYKIDYLKQAGVAERSKAADL